MPLQRRPRRQSGRMRQRRAKVLGRRRQQDSEQVHSDAPVMATPVAPERTRISSPVHLVHRALVPAPPRRRSTRQITPVAPTPVTHMVGSQDSSDFLNDAKNVADFSDSTDCIIT